MERERPPAWVLLVGAACMPFALMTLYLFFSRWPTEWATGESDWLAIAVASTAGAAFLARFDELPWFVRGMLCISYTILVGFAIIVYTFGFVCTVFGKCL